MGKENHVFPTVRRHIEFINNKMWHIKVSVNSGGG